MKKLKHIAEATRIGNDSWQLLNYAGLPIRPDKKKQIEALKQDRDWIRNKCEEICREIDRLIAEIDND